MLQAVAQMNGLETGIRDAGIGTLDHQQGGGTAAGPRTRKNTRTYLFSPLPLADVPLLDNLRNL